MAKTKKIRIHKLTDMGWSKLVEVCSSDDEKLCYDPDKDADILTDTIMDQQKYIRENEETKFKNIVEVFREVLHVYK